MEGHQDLSLSQLMEMQHSLYEANKDNWTPRTPEHGRDHILFMIEEIGEFIAILKKKGEGAVMTDPAVRAHFLEEMSDALMYFVEILLCFSVTPEEFSASFTSKHDRNLHRDYAEEYREKFED